MTPEDANRRTEQRQAIIYELLVLDGVPADMITAVALMALGIRMHHDLLQDNVRLAEVLQKWADGVREGRYLGPPILKD
jgi:hypothetical protein